MIEYKKIRIKLKKAALDEKPHRQKSRWGFSLIAFYILNEEENVFILSSVWHNY